MDKKTSSCIHELPEGQCGFCKEVPFGIYSVGFKTQHGNAFHNWKDCYTIEKGQSFAVSRGGVATEIISVTWSSSLQNLQPCEWCCALFYTGGELPDNCLVEIEGKEVNAKIIKSRYVRRNEWEYQIFLPETGEIWFFPKDRILAQGPEDAS